MENLVVQTAFLGDLVLSFPLLRNLSELFPEDSLTVVCRSGLGGLVEQLKFVDQVIEVDKKNPTLWKNQKRLLRQKTFRHILSPHQSPRTALLIQSLRAQGEKVGFNLWWNSFAFSKRILKPDYFPDSLRQLALLTALHPTFAEEYSQVAETTDLQNLTDTSQTIDFRSVALPSWAELRRSDLKFLPDFKTTSSPANEKSRTLFIAPGSVWATKRWTIEGYKSVASHFLDLGWHVKVVGSKEEADLAQQVAHVNPKIENYAGQWTLSETLNNFCTGQVLLANDSGAIHLAALAELPTVAIFGPTTLALGFRPWQQKALVVQKKLSCRPCGRHGHQHCPLGTHDCMKQVTVEMVLAGIQKLIT
ncbi:MAG: glycosyltransferase family 9 protein [Bdellovibrionales bacterium]|nr:glycosyltransferase family 9 protein [Bdellovibrionales bacterium]